MILCTGLDDTLVQYEEKVKEQEITGTKLLNISRQDLEKLEVLYNKEIHNKLIFLKGSLQLGEWLWLVD